MDKARVKEIEELNNECRNLYHPLGMYEWIDDLLTYVAEFQRNVYDDLNEIILSMDDKKYEFASRKIRRLCEEVDNLK